MCMYDGHDDNYPCWGKETIEDEFVSDNGDVSYCYICEAHIRIYESYWIHVLTYNDAEYFDVTKYVPKPLTESE